MNKDLNKTLRTWSKTDCTKFAVWCAKRVTHLHDNTNAHKAISAAERWIDDPSKENAAVANEAYIAANTIGENHKFNATSAAHAASAAAGFAAASAASYAAGVYASASYACAAASYAAHAESVADVDLLDTYLGEL